MLEQSGSIKLSWAVAIQLAATLIATGMILGKIDYMQRQINTLTTNMPNDAGIVVEIGALSARTQELSNEDSRIWAAINAQKAALKHEYR